MNNYQCHPIHMREEDPHSVYVDAKDEKTGHIERFRFRHSDHSRERASQRGINQLRLSLALTAGDVIQKQGLLFCILGEDRIPDRLCKHKDKLKNTVVVVDGRSDLIITCYRAKDPYKQIRKKSKNIRVFPYTR